MIAVAVIAALMGNAAWLAIVAYNAVEGWTSRRRVERLSRGLLLQVVRPRLKQLEVVGLLLYAGVLMASIAYLALKMPPTAASTPVSSLANKAIDTVFLYASIVLWLDWPCFRWTRLEVRECGLVYGSDFWTWENIREWGWKGGGDTLRLKVPHRIMWFGIARGDKGPIQEILEQRLGLVRGPS
jgi:hypothetical protein